MAFIDVQKQVFNKNKKSFFTKKAPKNVEKRKKGRGNTGTEGVLWAKNGVF